jgi:hypothetical protein
MLQTQFFASQEDLEQFFEWVYSTFGVGFIKREPVQDPKRIEVFKKVTEEIFTSRSQHGNFSDNGVYIEFNDLNYKLHAKYIKEQNHYLIQSDKSGLIELLNGGVYKDRYLIGGRMSVHPNYFENSHKKIDLPDLKSKYTKLISWFKKNAVTRASNYYYVMPGAYELAKKGVQLKTSRIFARGYHIGPSGGLESFLEDKGMKVTDEGVISSQVDWSEETKQNLWKEFPKKK